MRGRSMDAMELITIGTVFCICGILLFLGQFLLRKWQKKLEREAFSTDE